jgi:hypothetical protein
MSGSNFMTEKFPPLSAEQIAWHEAYSARAAQWRHDWYNTPHYRGLAAAQQKDDDHADRR